jgi:hypothetical protein
MLVDVESKEGLRPAGRPAGRGLPAGPLRCAEPIAQLLAALVLCALVALPACSAEADAVEVALRQLAEGEAEAAERGLTELFAAAPDDPVLAYDLGCAHQARGRIREARARYADVLARGDRRLRARAHTNLAMLAVDQLAARVGGEPADLKAERRDEVRRLADQALDELQRARDLDPGLAEVVRRQDLLARWQRLVEDAWRERDRAAERDARAALDGAAFLGAWLEAERGLVARLAEGELLEDLELRQRDLRDELPRAGELAAAAETGPAEAFRVEVGAAVEAAGPELAAILGLLRDGRVDEAATAIQAAADALTAAFVLWTDPGAALGLAAREQAAFVAALQQRTFARAADPDGAGLAVRERGRADLATRERQIARWAGNLARRLAPEHADPAWSPRFVARALAKLPEITASLQLAAERIEVQGPQALLAATRAAQGLQSLALDWQLAGMEAAALAARLEAEQLRLTRAADALAEDEPAAAEVLERLRRMAEGVARSIAWNPLRSDQADQRARIGFVAEAVERALAPPAEPSGPTAGDPAADPAAEQRAAEERAQRRAVLEPLVEAARLAFDAAAAAAEEGPGPATVAAMHSARTAVRRLALALGAFDALVERAAGEQQALAAAGEAVAAEPDAAPSAARYRDARREQDLTGALVQQLDRAVEAEREALERPVAAGPGGEPPAAETAADRDERAARFEVIGAVADLLTQAAEAATAARDALPAAVDGDPARRAATVAAAPHQRRAADLLADALRQLREAQLSLLELTTRVLDGETAIVAAARELAAGRAPADPSGSDLGWPRLLAGQREAGSYVARMPAALDREFPAEAAEPGGAQAQPAPQGGAGAREVLGPLVEAVAATQAAALGALGAEPPAEPVRRSEDVLDAARALWRELAEFQALLERAVAEEEQLVGRSQPFVATAPSPDRLAAAVGDQRRTRSLVPALQARLEEAAAEQAAQQAQQQAQQPTSAGPGPGAAAGGLSEEVVALARENLPAAEQAMTEAEAHLEARAWNDALDRQDEALRLLREILDALEDQQQEDQQDQQQEDQQQEEQQQDQEQDAQQQEQQPSSPEELQRLLQAVRERNQRRPEPISRTPVQEDW